MQLLNYYCKIKQFHGHKISWFDDDERARVLAVCPPCNGLERKKNAVVFILSMLKINAAAWCLHSLWGRCDNAVWSSRAQWVRCGRATCTP